MSVSLLSTHEQVIRALLRYTDWWQPVSTSIILVGAARRSSAISDGIPPGLLSTLDERSELCRRMEHLDERDRKLLYLWYLRQLAAQDIARELRISRRQCFRRRAAAIDELVRMSDSTHV
jgi:DNA-directed RNA polymerase specialized sigma subunit